MLCEEKMSERQKFENRHNEIKAKDLKLNIQRGQSGDDNFNMSNEMLTIADGKNPFTESKLDYRKYPDGIAGISLAPCGATFPYGKDPKNCNIRITPTRPRAREARLATEVLALCVQLAS
jgi:hypothetical protein